ncbi:glutaredoxin-like protein NrdH [Tersicoccus sp. Bi-70]|uniref:glutaredoxin-like protein NrdH n=1 Tax=Tersicoccus sp. Bi-70 TaxID=1897634 RepID=UPI002693C7A6
MITVYSKPACMQCTMTQRALDRAGLTYEVIDLTQNPDALTWVTEDLGYSQAPIVVINDDDHWSGFQPDHIARITANA